MGTDAGDLPERQHPVLAHSASSERAPTSRPCCCLSARSGGGGSLGHSAAPHPLLVKTGALSWEPAFRRVPPSVNFAILENTRTRGERSPLAYLKNVEDAPGAEILCEIRKSRRDF